MGLPTPYYDHAGITIYHGDCREILPFLGRFDLLLTDPPYGIGEHGGKARTRGKTSPNHERMGWDNERPDRLTFDLIRSKAFKQIIFGGNYFSDMLPASRCWLYWRKLMGGDFADGELIWTSMDSVVKEFTKPNKGGNNEHPTQKPLEVIQWALQLAGEVETILDPFAGSGTTGRAAKDLGKKAVLIEREERYCEIAAGRMAQEVLLFT
jgi:site-specific DNA-methyltransferase (adenine-specific)